MSAKTGKRPLRSLSAHEKLEAIRRVHDGESKASVARDIGVPESTLRGWCKNENKISYLSRQSSPETDESIAEPKEKRPKLEDHAAMVQPFNLSLKTPANMYTPTESLYTPVDYSKSDMMDSAPKTPQNLSFKTETPKSTASQMTERERNRAELARLSIELGLNRPEMFTANSNVNPTSTSSNSNLADIAANINLLTQWNNIMMQQQLLQGQPKTTKASLPDTTSNVKSVKPPKEQQPVEDYIKCWLRAQEALMTTNQRPAPNGLPAPPPVTSSSSSSTSNQNNPYQSSWFWKWYKQLSYAQQATTSTVNQEKPILYQQLTKANEPVSAAENHLLGDPSNNNNINDHNKAKSVLDNLLCVNNNNNLGKSEQSVVIGQNEALEHGEQFMKWLESCSDPSVTAMQIMQFKTLLNNVKNGVERRNNGDMYQQSKTKVKRK